MNALPRLADEPLEDKLAAYRRVGGHPKTIELLDGWLADGRRLRALLDDPTLGERLAGEWEAYFLGELLARLAPAERDALTTLAILEAPFWWQMARDLLAVGVEARQPAAGVSSEDGDLAVASPLRMARWLDLSLIEHHHTDDDGDAWYTLHPVVREYLLGQLDRAQVHALHARAAAYCGAPFVEAARQALAEAQRRGDLQTAPTDEQIEAEARGGAVEFLTHQTQDMARAHRAMERALAWQSHLFQAGRFAAAGEIVTAVIPVLARWGQRDLVKGLLRRSIETLESDSARAATQGNLATLLRQEGRLAEALAMYEESIHIHEELGAKKNLAARLGNISIIYQQMGEYDQAIEKQEASLQIQREIGDEEGQAISLHQLSILYMLKEDYVIAMARSQETEELFRKLGIEVHVATTLHQQGLIFNRMDRPDDAFERFRQSLEIKHRIGDESGAADSLGELGKLLRDTGQMREAIGALNEALEIFRRLGDPKMGIALEMLGSIHERQGEYGAALEKYQQALQILQQVGMVQGAENNRRHIARVREKLGG
jgi:tetratricopeptide (TPR) repeat protein